MALTTSVSLPAPARIVAPWIGPVIVSAPLEPLTVIVSVPVVQFVKVQPDMLSVPAGAMLTTRACAAVVVPVIAAAAAILPVPNWAELKVAVEIPTC